MFLFPTLESRRVLTFFRVPLTLSAAITRAMDTHVTTSHETDTLCFSLSWVLPIWVGVLETSNLYLRPHPNWLSFGGWDGLR